MSKSVTTEILSPVEAHREALAAWRTGQRDQAQADMAARFDQALLAAIERRALAVVETLGA